jgi:hypothetical protein
MGIQVLSTIYDSRGNVETITLEVSGETAARLLAEFGDEQLDEWSVAADLETTVYNVLHGLTS